MDEEIILPMLPEEIMIEIFNYLSPKMIKTSSLVCKKWNDIIGDSRQIMKKFRLNLEETDNMIHKAKLLKRKHQEIKVKNLNENSLAVINLHNLQSLQLSCCKIESSKLVTVLDNLPLLEVFKSRAVDIIDKHTRNESMTAHVKLRELRIEYGDIEIVKLFETDTLKIFEVYSLLTENCDDVINLLKFQKDLEEFGIGGVICENFFESPQIFDFKFRLKSFKIDKASMRNDRNELLFKFLLLHQESLNLLKILYPICNNVHIFILENLPNLKHLEIPITSLTEKTTEFIDKLVPNTQIEKIRFFGIPRNLANAKLVMNIFKNLKHLDLSQITANTWFMEFLLHLSKTMKNLEGLKIPNLFNQNFHQNILFPKLKEFSVAKVYDETVFNPFLRRHSDTLEKITIGWTDDNFIKGLTVDEIMNCHNLKHVIISSYSPLVTRMFNKVSSKNKPWTLESRIKNHLDLEYIPLIFNFPDDKAVWDDRCRIWSDELIREFSTLDNYGLNAFVNKYK